MPARRTLPTIGTRAAWAIAVVGLVMGAGPARAAELNVVDPAGDATAAHLVESTPRPSEDELDILSVRYSSTGSTFRVDLRMAKVGIPIASNGFTYRLNFTHSDVAYHFLYQVTDVPTLPPEIFAFRATKDNTQLPCSCTATMDAKAATLQITANIPSLSRAMRAHNLGSAPIVPGTRFSGLMTSADRIMGARLVEVDFARAAADTNFSF